MKAINTINEVRAESSKISKNGNGRTAVIVETPFSANKSIYGVQFWTVEMIDKQTAINTDKSISTFIQIL